MDPLMLKTALSEDDVKALYEWQKQQCKRINNAEETVSLLREENECLKCELAQWKRPHDPLPEEPTTAELCVDELEVKCDRYKQALKECHLLFTEIYEGYTEGDTYAAGRGSEGVLIIDNVLDVTKDDSNAE